jgi:hypothetical protein
MKLNQIKQECVIMFFDRLGNAVTGEPIVEEPVVESYYDPNRPVRPGFEKPEMVQEGWFNPKPNKETHQPTTIEDVETIHDVVIDKDFKKFITENPNGCKFKYPDNKIVSKEILEFIDDEGDPSICSLNQFINANCEYDGCIEIYDYCLYIGGWIDDKALYLATNKSSCAPEGSIIFADIIENGYDYTDRIFAKSFKDLLKNANIEKSIKEYSEMDLDEMSDYITEATNRTLKELKQHQKDVEKHADITDKAGFHKLVKKNMKTSKGYENATGASGVATAKTGTVDIELTSNSFKPGSPAEKLFDRLFEIVKKTHTDKTEQISTATRKELFSILGLPDNQFDIYPVRCVAYDMSYFKIVKLCLFKSVGTNRVFPKVGYRFFHASKNPDIAKTGLIPSLGSTHGLIDQATGKPTINRSYNKKSCFFMAIKNNESLLYNIINQAFRYGNYLYEYKPRKSDVFYEDLFSRPGHVSVMKDLLNIPGVIPVFINSNTPLPVKRIDKNVKIHTLVNDIEANQKTDKDMEEVRKYQLKEYLKPTKHFEKLKYIIQNAKSVDELREKPIDVIDKLYKSDKFYDAELLHGMYGVISPYFEDDECNITNNDSNLKSIKKELLLKISDIQQKRIKQNKQNMRTAYEKVYKPAKQVDDISKSDVYLMKQRLKSMHNYPAFESYIMRDDSFDYDVFIEAKIDAADRNELKDSCFGLVYTDENGKKIRKYPLTDKDGKLDENHIRQAVRFFNHCPKEHQHQLALNILHAAHKLRLDTTKWDTVNKAAEENDED